ncbi:MAG: hypothetical protein HY903_14550 [Deltaproteobacteria bacterium]|nr:hypothetical protein [Deltaproteobacteria bacterium]
MKIQKDVIVGGDKQIKAGDLKQVGGAEVKGQKTAKVGSKHPTPELPPNADVGPNAIEAYIGAKLAGQMSRIPQFKGKSLEKAAFKLILDPTGVDKRNAFSIYFEAESKDTFLDNGDIKRMAAALQESMTKGVEVLLPEGKAGVFAGWTVKIDKVDKPTGAMYHDLYMDDAKGTLKKAGALVRVRVIEGGIGRLVTKLPGALIQGSSVMGRFESNHSLKDKSVEQLVKEATPDNDNNPFTLLKREFPDLDLKSLHPDVEIVDRREQFVLSNPEGEGKFLLTLDHVTSINQHNKKEGTFTEFEIERMDGSVMPKDVGELIKLSRLVGEQFNLVASPGTKHQRGAMVTE